MHKTNLNNTPEHPTLINPTIPPQTVKMQPIESLLSL